MILYWATFIAILGCMQPVGQGMDTRRVKSTSKRKEARGCLPEGFLSGICCKFTCAGQRV